MKIQNLYDSHVHWAATGDSLSRLNLRQLQNENDVQNLKVKPHHFKGDWLTGFGWDQNLWTTNSQAARFPVRQTLDQYFGEHPVAFTRTDGHAIWLNSLALKQIGLLDQYDLATDKAKAGMSGGYIEVDASGNPSGVLVDMAMEVAMKAIPNFTAGQVKGHLKDAAQHFNANGFTHIRDLSCDLQQWQSSMELFRSNELNIAVEQFFHVLELENLEKTIQLVLALRPESHALLRLKGIKIYYDGALGSEGALLSEPYSCKCSGPRGLALMPKTHLEQAIKIVWSAGLEIAIHAIGDEAAHHVAETAFRVRSSGISGVLNIEHLQMVRDETLDLLENTNVTIHMQPCHWLSDKKWASAKLGPMSKYLFRWSDLENREIPFYFGSDSPIEHSSLFDNIRALGDALDSGISSIKSSVVMKQSHPDQAWTPQTFTEIEDGKVTRVEFCGKNIFSVER
jgi:predicted amidohydrolase YtcJ